MPRIYSGFPGRGPGIGLLLLRIAIGATLVAYAVAYLFQLQDFGITVWAAMTLALVSGVSLLIGFLTPVVSLAALGLMAGTGFSWLPAPGDAIAGNHLALDVIVMAMAIIFLGPGAFSVDALLFGRRRIIIPRTSSHSKP